MNEIEKAIEQVKTCLKNGCGMLNSDNQDFINLVHDALREKQARDSQGEHCHLCQRTDDYQLFCRGQEMTMTFCAFCGRKLKEAKAE